MTYSDTTGPIAMAARSLDSVLAALAAQAASATRDLPTTRRLALAVVAGCDRVVMLEALEAADPSADDAFAQFMAGDDSRDADELLAVPF